MGSSETPQDQQNNGDTRSKIGSTQEQWEHLCSELGELSLVVGEFRQAIRQSDYRRIESLQGPIDQAFQSAEETVKKLQASYYPYWYTDPSGNGRPVVTGWHLGFRGKIGDEPNKV